MLCAFQIETINRELDGILYQALHLGRHGLPSLIGDRMANEYIKNFGKPLIYFDKDQQKHTNDIVMNNGGVVLNVNAEGQGFVDQPREMQLNFSKVADYVTRICLWGERQKEILESLLPPDKRDMLAITGHPSFDLTSPDFVPYFRNKAIIDEHGEDYILFNTSFAMFNHQMGFDNYVKMLGKMKEWEVYGKDHHLKHLKNRCLHQERIAKAMVDMAGELAKTFPERHIVIRPHPGEDPNFYMKALTGHDNVFIERGGAAREWIASAGAVIHHDCTTGMEASLMGKLVLQFEPYNGIEGSATLMTHMGLRVADTCEAETHIRRGVMPKEAIKTIRRELTPYLANLEGNAASRLAAMASKYSGNAPTTMPEPLKLWENAKCWRKYASKLLRARQPGRNGRKVRYALNKFSRLTMQEVKRRLAGLRRIEPNLPEVDVEQLCLNTFLIRPKG